MHTVHGDVVAHNVPDYKKHVYCLLREITIEFLIECGARKWRNYLLTPGPAGIKDTYAQNVPF